MAEIFTTYYASPPCMIKISGSDVCVDDVVFLRDNDLPLAPQPTSSVPPVLKQCVAELNEYFRGERRVFNVAVQQQGTAFQQRVWEQLLAIPYGSTISYLELSKRIGDVKAIRAAASTNGKNKIGIIVPCHRVIGSNGDLVGYAGGLSNKKWLLQHEARFAHGIQSLF